MQKRGLMIVLFLVLLAGSVSAWSTLSQPLPAAIYEGSVEAVRLSIDNFNKLQPIKEIQVTLPGVNITSVTLTPATLWQESHTGTFVRWFNDTVSTSSANDIFEFNAFVLPVLANTTVTLIVTKINQNGSNASENHTITILNDATGPVIVSLTPANGSSLPVRASQLITARADENQSQLGAVVYAYCPCTANSTNCTANATVLNLTCTGNNCNGTADFSSFTEGDYACYNLTAANNVGGRSSAAGKITFVGIPPAVFDFAPTAGKLYLVTDTVEIAVNATDNNSVDTVQANITYPNGTSSLLTLNKIAGTDRYSNNFAIPGLAGQYNITFVANDTRGNINNTVTTNFQAVPVYNIIFTLNPTSIRPGRTVRAAGTVKLANGSGIPETKVAINVRGTETNVTLTNGTFSHTFNAPNTAGNYNIEVKVYAASGYNYSATKRLRVQDPIDYSTGWGGDWEGGAGYVVEEEGTADEEPEPEQEDAGTAKAPEQKSAGTMLVEEEPTPEEVIDEILSKPNQVTGSAVGLGGATSLLALLLLVLGVATLAYSNARIRGHVHKFAKEKVGSKFKKKEIPTKAFSDEEWEEYFRRLREN